MPRDLLRRRVELKQVGPGALRRAEEDAVGRPADETGIFVEAIAQRLDAAAVDRRHRDDRVLIVEKWFRHRRHESDASAVGRPPWVRVGPRLSDEGAPRAAGDIDDRNVGAVAICRVARDAVVEHDGAAVGRPLEATDDECARRERLGRNRAARRGRQRQQVEVGHPPILVFDAEVAELLLALLDAVGHGVGHGVDDARPVRSPGKAVDALVTARQPLGFAAADVQAVELAPAVAIRDESEPAAVGRPRRLQTRLRRAGQLARLGRRPEPDFGLELVVVPVGFADGVGHRAAVGRDDRIADAFEVEEVVNAGSGALSRRRRNGRGGQ